MTRLDGWWQRSGSGFTLGIPASALQKQAALQLLIAPICAAIAWLYGVGEDPVATVAIGGVMAVLAAPLVIYALVTLARAGTVSEQSRVVLDQRRITHAGGVVPYEAVTGLVVRQQSAWLAFLVLDAEVRSAQQTGSDPWVAPAEGRVRLLRRVPPRAGEELAALGRQVAEVLGVELRVEGGIGRPRALGIPPATLAMLCWLPVQGVFLIASLAVLVLRPADPLVRFHARQSLVLFAVELAGFAGAVALGLAGLAVGGEEVGLVAGGAAFALVAVARLVVRLIGTVQAARYQPWVVPGLGGVTRQWLPDAP